MIMPLGDDNTDRVSTPFVNYALIAANILVFVLLQGMGSNDKFTYAFSTIPQEITTGVDIDKTVKLADKDSGEVLGAIDLQPSVTISEKTCTPRCALR